MNPDYKFPTKYTPAERSIAEQMTQLFENSGPLAFKVMQDLLTSSLPDIRYKASSYILGKLVPEKFNDPFSFLSSRTKEELIGTILGSGIFDKLKLQEAGMQIKDAEIIPAIDAKPAEKNEVG